jgi:hypothetical protein
VPTASPAIPPLSNSWNSLSKRRRQRSRTGVATLLRQVRLATSPAHRSHLHPVTMRRRRTRCRTLAETTPSPPSPTKGRTVSTDMFLSFSSAVTSLFPRYSEQQRSVKVPAFCYTAPCGLMYKYQPFWASCHILQISLPKRFMNLYGVTCKKTVIFISTAAVTLHLSYRISYCLAAPIIYW